MPCSMPTESLCHLGLGQLCSPKNYTCICQEHLHDLMLTVSVIGSWLSRVATGLIVGGDLGVLVMESDPEERLV